MGVKRIFALLALAMGIGLMGYAHVHLAEAKQIHHEGDAVYSDLSTRVKEHTDAAAPAISAGDYEKTDAAQGQTTVNEGQAAAQEKDYIPAISINFNILETINKDAVAWLYSPDTVIDYPVLKADDYAYYLNHLPDGTLNANGSLFIDFNNAPDFSETLTVIYGHNMRSKMMFGSLAEYKNQSYYNEHPFMYLYTKEVNYRIELLYGCVIGAGVWRERSFMYKENVGSLLAYAERNTTFESCAEYAEGDRIIAMSTCSYEFEGARYVVIGKVSEVR